MIKLTDFFIQYRPKGRANHELFYAYAKAFRHATRALIYAMNKEHDLKDWHAPDLDPAFLRGYDYGIVPAMYLFRHCVELQLKGFILHLDKNEYKRIQNNHDLQALLNIIEEKKIKALRIPTKSKTIIAHLGTVDPSSQSFRYPSDNKGNSMWTNKSDKELKYVNTMRHVTQMMDTVFADLENQEGNLDAEDEREGARACAYMPTTI